MKKYIILTIILFGFAINSVSQDFPKPRGAVNDFANVIPAATENQIEGLCREVWQKTGTAIVDVTIQSIGDNYIEDYANRLYQSWGIGKKGEDKGVLIVNAITERKIRIETGYGVEGILPDGLTGEILDRYAIPSLRKGDYGTAHLNTVQAVAGIIAKDANVEITGSIQYSPQTRTTNPTGSKWIGRLIALLFFFLIFGTRGRILPWLILGSLFGGGPRNRGGGWGGGGFSGGFGGFGGGLSGGGGASRGY